jgi:Fe-S-cluster containining protein
MTPLQMAKPEHAGQGLARYEYHVVRRSVSAWWNYIDSLREAGRLVEIDGVYIDGESMFRRRFTCDPRVCSPGKRPNGLPWRHKGEKSCCAELVVDLTREEVESLRANWEPVREYLITKDRFFRGKELEDCIELGDDYEYSLKKRGKRCIFALRDGDWGIRCGIHAGCLDQGLSVEKVKPVTCDTFPMILIDLQPGLWYLGAHDAEVDPVASLGDEGIEPFPCLKTARRGKRMYDEMSGTIRRYLGEAFFQKLVPAAEAYLAKPRPDRITPPWDRD